MNEKKISELQEVAELSPDTVLPIVQNGRTYKVALSTLADYMATLNKGKDGVGIDRVETYTDTYNDGLSRVDFYLSNGQKKRLGVKNGSQATAYVGCIVETATLNTMNDVVLRYGGKTWNKIQDTPTKKWECTEV